MTREIHKQVNANRATHDEPDGLFELVAIAPLGNHMNGAVGEKEQTNGGEKLNHEVHWKSDLTAMRSVLAVEHAVNPCLFHNICDVVRENRFLRQASALKDYLFITSADSTLRTNDNIHGIRLRDADERRVALDALRVLPLKDGFAHTAKIPVPSAGDPQ